MKKLILPVFLFFSVVTLADTSTLCVDRYTYESSGSGAHGGDPIVIDFTTALYNVYRLLTTSWKDQFTQIDRKLFLKTIKETERYSMMKVDVKPYHGPLFDNTAMSCLETKIKKTYIVQEKWENQTENLKMGLALHENLLLMEKKSGISDRKYEISNKFVLLLKSKDVKMKKAHKILGDCTFKTLNSSLDNIASTRAAPIGTFYRSYPQIDYIGNDTFANLISSETSKNLFTREKEQTVFVSRLDIKNHNRHKIEGFNFLLVDSAKKWECKIYEGIKNYNDNSKRSGMKRIPIDQLTDENYPNPTDKNTTYLHRKCIKKGLNRAFKEAATKYYHELNPANDFLRFRVLGGGKQPWWEVSEKDKKSQTRWYTFSILVNSLNYSHPVKFELPYKMVGDNNICNFVKKNHQRSND